MKRFFKTDSPTLPLQSFFSSDVQNSPPRCACCCPKLLPLLLSLLLPLVVFSQDPDLADDERARLEEVYRTSDQEGEIPVGRSKREGRQKRVSVPKGAFRIGCVCMDGTHSDTRSIGACSGHGGVRFWVYRTTAGDTVHVLTARHERHPQPLDAAEMSEISQKRADRIQRLPTAAKPLAPTPYSAPTPPVVILPDAAANRFDWGDALGVAVGAVALFFIVRMVLGWAGANEKLVRYALRHLLRPGKRPPARPLRPATRKKRRRTGTEVRVRSGGDEQKRLE